MQRPTHVLIITRDGVMRNLLEQVFIIRDVQIVTAATVQGAEAIINLWGLGAFGLVIIDTEALGDCEVDQQHITGRILQAWTAAHPRLPFIVLGSLFQKHAVHMSRANGVRVLVKPFRLDELIDAIDDVDWGKRCLNPSLPHGPR